HIKRSQKGLVKEIFRFLNRNLKISIKETISNDVFEFGQRRAISLGWILPDTKVNKYERLVESIDDEVQKDLQSLEKGNKLEESILLVMK
ncbi:hypothetical protein QYM36_008957, partial [Artemia franciscana]